MNQNQNQNENGNPSFHKLPSAGSAPKKKKNFAFFRHESCEYFPCHKVPDPATFNCLFCYCPLYTLGPDCGGAFTYTEKGIKNCKNCTLPHQEGGWEHIQSNFSLLASLAKR